MLTKAQVKHIQEIANQDYEADVTAAQVKAVIQAYFSARYTFPNMITPQRRPVNADAVRRDDPDKRWVLNDTVL
jgi:hypothetical protein